MKIKFLFLLMIYKKIMLKKKLSNIFSQKLNNLKLTIIIKGNMKILEIKFKKKINYFK